MYDSNDNGTKRVGPRSLDVAYVTQTRSRDMSKTQCHSCKEYGHMANQCNKQFCNYCKKVGHLIADCRRRSQNRTNRALHTTATDSPVPPLPVTPTEPAPASHDTTALTPELVQQMIQSTFFAIAFTVNNKTFSI